MSSNALRSGRCRRRPATALLAAAVVPLSVTPSGAAVTYTAANTIDLHPSLLGAASGSRARGSFGGQQVGEGYGDNTATGRHALLWAGTAAGAVDLHPAALLGADSNSYAYATTGGQQVGFGYGDATAAGYHALLWSGTAASAVDLHPAALLGANASSFAYATSGTQQVGHGYGSNTSDRGHALLWTGTAASVVDLHPSALLGASSASYARSTTGARQAGYGYGANTGAAFHALLWTGSAGSAVDLNPSALLGADSNSFAYATAGVQQVGHGYGANTSDRVHALLWSGTAASAVDLHPAALLGAGSDSFARATTGARQVGYGYGPNTGDNAHALAWSGTAASAVDLHALLPAGFDSSQATAVDAYGNVAGFAYAGGGPHAVAWLAGNLYDVAGTGDWGAASNWTAGIPAAGNDVLLLQADAVDRTVAYAGPATAAPLGDVTVDATGAGALTLAQADGTLSTTNVTVGLLGRGAFDQSGGTHVVAGALTLAAGAGARAAYTLGAGATLHANAVVVNAGATFTQAGGTLVAGAFTQNGGTVAGTLTSQGAFTYNGGAFAGRLVNSGTVALNAPFTAGDGIENHVALSISQGVPVTVNGAGLDNFGTLTLDGGLLAGTGPVTNDVGGTLYARGTISPALANYGQLSTTGPLVLSSPSSNVGSITLAPNQGLRPNAPFSNAGAIALGGGNVGGTGTVTNLPGGSIVGPGGVANPVANAGGLIRTGSASTLLLSNLVTNSAGGSIVVGANAHLTAVNPFPSSGSIQLLGPNSVLSGGAIANSGTVKGAGQVASAVANGGVIRAEGGDLTFTGTLTNAAPALIQAGAGTTVFVAQGLAANAGTISLAGGTFDNNGQSLANAGTINGSGTLRTGALTNGAGGLLFLANAGSSLYGPVTNAPGGTVDVVSNATTFFGPVVNNGAFSLISATATFAGGFAGSAPGALGGTLAVDAASSIVSSYIRQGSVASSGTLAIRPTGLGGGTSAADTLDLAGSGTFDLADTRLIVNSIAADAIRQYLRDGRLTSSVAAADPRLALGYAAASQLNVSTWGSLPANPTSILTRLTWLGDANLDGALDADDYALLDRAFARSVANAHWTDGDFNYDGLVTPADYLLLDTAYLRQQEGSPSAAFLVRRGSQFGADYVSELLTSVPEPSGIVGCGVVAAAVFPRRRRR